MDKEKLILALVSNPKVFDPTLSEQYRQDFHGIISIGAKYSPEDIAKVEKHLRENNMAVNRLFECAEDILKEWENQYGE